MKADTELQNAISEAIDELKKMPKEEFRKECEKATEELIKEEKDYFEFLRET